MTLTKRLLVSLLILGATLTAVTVAQVTTKDGFTPGEIAYLSDIAADVMRPAGNVGGVVDEGWTICHALTAVMSAATAAERV